MKRLSCTVLVALAFSACAGPTVKVEPVTVRPIHLTIDVNLHDAAPAQDASARKRAAP